MIDNLANGFMNLMSVGNMFWLLFGLILGMVAGAIPGISGTMLMAIIIPMTFGMDPSSAIIFLLAIYVASVYSGSITGILFRIPGAPEAVATTLDGYAMNQRGMAAEALGVDLFSSACGGIFATIVLIFMSPQLAKIALSFGPAEYFAACLLALTVMSSIGKSMVKAFITGLLGLLLATIGIDPMSGVERFTFGLMTLKTGMNFIPVLIGLFAMSEVLRRLAEGDDDSAPNQKQEANSRVNARLPSLSLIKRLKWTILRSSFIGTIIGILPGIGATTAGIVGYSEAVRWSKHPEKFGTGIPEGVAAPEAANNAGAVGTLVPFLTLGIPGGANTALLIGAFLIHNLRPGPLLFIKEPTLVYTIFVGVLLSNLLILLLGKLFIRYFVKVIMIPYNILGPCIVVLATVGAFGVRNNAGDVILMFIFGIVGYLFEKYSFPITPLIISMVLGPIAESSFRRAMLLSDNDLMFLVSKPIAGGLIAASFISILFPFIRGFLRKRKEKLAEQAT